MKIRFNKLIKANFYMDATLGKFRGGSHPLTFYKEELSGGAPNSTIPLLIRARMENFEVRCILVDHGSLVDIIYTKLFANLQLNESHLTSYIGSDLWGFNGASTKPWGYVELIVTFRRGVMARAIKTQFLVID